MINKNRIVQLVYELLEELDRDEVPPQPKHIPGTKECTIHKTTMFHRSNERGEWFSHRVEETGEWCKGEVQNGRTQNTHSRPQTKASPRHLLRDENTL